MLPRVARAPLEAKLDRNRRQWQDDLDREKSPRDGRICEEREVALDSVEIIVGV